ncbi:hypothetical protein Q3G72_011206 [Acer saccharum]|nr:hypothetical protein Q3G72_011206 [Acer saccharum]
MLNNCRENRITKTQLAKEFGIEGNLEYCKGMLMRQPAVGRTKETSDDMLMLTTLKLLVDKDNFFPYSLLAGAVFLEVYAIWFTSPSHSLVTNKYRKMWSGSMASST